jgi:hypothetical protein
MPPAQTSGYLSPIAGTQSRTDTTGEMLRGRRRPSLPSRTPGVYGRLTFPSSIRN